MSRYLDKFVTTMPDSQARQILDFLTELKDQGAIRTVAEYNSKLRDLTAELQQTEPAPLFKLFWAIINDDIDSDRFNTMVKAAGKDLKTAFTEAEKIGQVLGLHKVLFKLTVLKALRRAVSELDKKITLYEFLGNNTDGFGTGQYNTFDNLAFKTDRSAPMASALYWDWRKNEAINAENDAVIDIDTERLVMPPSSNKRILPVSIDLVEDSTTTSSVRDVSLAGSKINNAIDGTLYTYWLYPILLDSPIANGPKIKVKLNLGATREVNILNLEPVPAQSMILENMTYVGTDGSSHTVSINATISKQTNIYFSSIVTDSVILTFSQPQGEPVMYYHQLGSNIWNAINNNELEPGQTDDLRVSRLSNELQDLITSDDLKTLCNIPDKPGWEVVKGHQYMFGFDNISFSNSRYRSMGVFISQVMETGKVGLLALKTNEINPTITIGNDTYSAFSFEYLVYKQNYDKNGVFVDSELIPILPLASGGSIDKERLWLTEEVSSSVPNVARLRMVPDISIGDPVIRKDLADTLTIGDDFTVYVEGSSSPGWRTTWSNVQTDIDTNATESDKLTVKIKFTDPSIVSIYTVDYNVYRGRQILDYVKIQKNGTLACAVSRGSKDIATSKLYLIVLMRRNYTGDTETCALEDYKLLVGLQESGKYSSPDLDDYSSNKEAGGDGEPRKQAS